MAPPLVDRLRQRLAAAQPQVREWLELFIPGQPSQRLPLYGGTYRIGRDHHQEISLVHPAVSKHHALLEQR